METTYFVVISLTGRATIPPNTKDFYSSTNQYMGIYATSTEKQAKRAAAKDSYADIEDLEAIEVSPEVAHKILGYNSQGDMPPGC